MEKLRKYTGLECLPVHDMDSAVTAFNEITEMISVTKLIGLIVTPLAPAVYFTLRKMGTTFIQNIELLNSEIRFLADSHPPPLRTTMLGELYQTSVAHADIVKVVTPLTFNAALHHFPKHIDQIVEFVEMNKIDFCTIYASTKSDEVVISGLINVMSMQADSINSLKEFIERM